MTSLIQESIYIWTLTVSVQYFSVVYRDLPGDRDLFEPPKKKFRKKVGVGLFVGLKYD